ncbi:MAG: nitronate monooxygenase [Ferruginibacter sp.]|nr:nitronate monooxygenase [Cytophagales bacterium]
MWSKTKFTRLLGTNYPIVLGPFGGGLSSVELTSTVSNLGGLGSFGAQPFTYDQIIECNNFIKQKTNQPYAINLWVDDRDVRLNSFGEAEYEKLKQLFKPYFDEFGVPMPERSADLGPTYEDQIQAILDAKPPVFSFVFGIPTQEVLEQCRSNNIVTIGAATTADEAVAVEKAGVDAVVATGFEAGGHRVSFLRSAEDSLTGTFSLVPQVADSVSIPVIAAGGIADARGIKAAFALGADAVQIGTAFLATKQSNATEEHKRKLFSNDAKYTTLTKLFTGRLARGIKSRLTDELKNEEHLVAPYPLQSLFLSALRSGVLSKGKSEYITFWSGQSASLLKFRDSTELFASLVEQTNQLFTAENTNH